MKHANDPGTIEMFEMPKRRGRPLQGKVALTPAERAARYRRRKADSRWDFVDTGYNNASVAELCTALMVCARHPGEADRLAAEIVQELSRRFPQPKGKK